MTTRASAGVLDVPFVGGHVGISTNLTGAAEPPSGAWVKLTAGENGAGQYNEGLLINESVTGSAPLVVATAEIAVGPMAGQVINLWNTENRYPQPGTSAGTVANDQMQQITGDWFRPANGTGGNDNSYTVGSSGQGAEGAFVKGQHSGGVFLAGTLGGTQNSLGFDSANSPNARTGDHTDVKHEQVTYYLRIQ